MSLRNPGLPELSSSLADAAAPPYRPSWRLLVVLMIVALLPRVTGVLWGGIHPDENVNASAKLLGGQWKPDEHYYPPLSNFLNAGAFAVMFVVGRLIGVWHSAADFRAQYFADITPFQMMGRLVCATLGSLAAPLTALLAARLGARRWGSVLAALLVALLPTGVLLAHISKSADVGMATSFILVALCFVDFSRDPNNLRRAAVLGVAMALAVSFKHSAVFFVGPVFVASLVLAWLGRRETPVNLVRAAGTIAVTAAVLWIVLNVPILADFKRFRDFQKVQQQMSFRPGTVTEIARAAVPYLTAMFTGTTIPVAVAFLIVPALRRSKAVIALWLCAVAGLFVVIKLTGVRPTPGLYLPYATLMTAFVGVALGTWISSARQPQRLMGVAAWAVCAAFLAYGSSMIFKQSLAEPAIVDVARTLRKSVPPDAKMLATREGHAGLPVSAQAQIDERARHERLAAKYKVKLPPLAEERVANVPGGYYVRRMPATIGGLEVYDEKDVKTVTPFAWPIQKEEYDLDYWTGQGFTVFVITDEQARLNSKVPAYVKLYEQIRANCDLVKEVKARKPLFWEGNTKIYRLRADAPSPQTRPTGM